MKKVVEPLLEWYLENKRELPWRKDKNPYHVWISEIMLQQTRIEAVKKYYIRFMERIPNIEELSKIDEDELLKLWEGLGYYSRARNLKKAAMKIRDEYNGIFPDTFEEIIKLPGIGEYTAGAISSISFNQKEVAIDGNVMRVYSRVMNKDIDVSDSKVKKEIGLEIKKLLPENSGDFNQGIMELGEVICIPNATPKCELCPLKKLCLAHKHHRESEIPRKIIKKEKQEEKITVFLLIHNEKIALRKRTDGLLKNMWEFPNINSFLSQDEIRNYFNGITYIESALNSTHIFTHKKWNMKSYLIKVEDKLDGYEWLSLKEIEENYAIPTAFKPFLEYIRNKEVFYD